MVRRRTASPQKSAPVRSAARPAAPAQSSYSAAPPPPPRPAAASPTAHAPPPAAHAPPMAAAPSQGPGLFAQMAATAGGVAIGSAVGHTIGNMMSGGGSSHEAAPVAQAAAPAPAHQGYSQPCEFEWKQFIECTQNQSDVSLCNGFNDVFKQCQARLA